MVAAPPIRWPPEVCSSARRPGQDLTALVIAASRTNAVWYVGRITLRTLAQLRELQHAVVSATHFHAARGWFSLWNAHKSLIIKFQFVQFGPRGRITFRSGSTARFRFSSVQFQTAASGLAQRMLRKLKESIFPQKRRQVHVIARNARRFLTRERDEARVFGQFQFVFKGFQTSHALAIERQLHPSAHQEALVELLHFQSVMQRLVGADHVIVQIKVQFRRRKLAFKREIPVFQMTQVDSERHGKTLTISKRTYP